MEYILVSIDVGFEIDRPPAVFSSTSRLQKRATPGDFEFQISHVQPHVRTARDMPTNTQLYLGLLECSYGLTPVFALSFT